jgi:nuclear GTP-binding protein
VLRDWSVGKFARYATPPKAQSGTTPTPEKWLAALYSNGDEAVLATLRSRKELRKTAGLGLVRFSPGTVDDRQVNIEDEWTVLDLVHEDSEDDNGEFGMEVDGDSGSDGDVGEEDDDADEEDEDDEVGEDSGPEMDDEEEEEEVEIPVTEMKKRKRGINPPQRTRPAKKVAFASTKGKQSSSRPQKKDKAPSSSILKKQEPRVTKKPSARPVKVANVPSSNKTKSTDGGSEAYDFSKFFK